MRVPPQPYLRVDRNDYSLDPALAGRRVEVRVSQREVHGGRARHRRARLPAPRAAFAGAIDAHRPRARPTLERQRARRRERARASTSRSGRWPRYDPLIPA